MPDLIVHDITVDLVDSFFGSSRDALKRSERFASDADESLGVRISNRREIQAVVECALASFLAIEAAVNRLFSDQMKGKKPTPFDRWLKARWHYGLRIEDKLALVLNEYADTDLLDFPVLRELFLEMTSFRNRLVHTAPQDYEMLVQPSEENPSSGTPVIVAERPREGNRYPKTGLSFGLWSLRYSDGAKCHEIMVLMLAFLSARFNFPRIFVLEDPEAKTNRYTVRTPEAYLAELTQRYFEVDAAKFNVKRNGAGST
jgi:hypothetical protein